MELKLDTKYYSLIFSERILIMVFYVLQCLHALVHKTGANELKALTHYQHLIGQVNDQLLPIPQSVPHVHMCPAIVVWLLLCAQRLVLFDTPFVVPHIDLVIDLCNRFRSWA